MGRIRWQARRRVGQRPKERQQGARLVLDKMTETPSQEELHRKCHSFPYDSWRLWPELAQPFDDWPVIRRGRISLSARLLEKIRQRTFPAGGPSDSCVYLQGRGLL